MDFGFRWDKKKTTFIQRQRYDRQENVEIKLRIRKLLYPLGNHNLLYPWRSAHSPDYESVSCYLLWETNMSVDMSRAKTILCIIPCPVWFIHYVGLISITILYRRLTHSWSKAESCFLQVDLRELNPTDSIRICTQHAHSTFRADNRYACCSS